MYICTVYYGGGGYMYRIGWPCDTVQTPRRTKLGIPKKEENLKCMQQ